MPNPILPSAIRDDFIAAIEGLVPAEVEHRTKAWRFIKSETDIPGSEVRTFTLRIKPRADGPLLGCGNDFRFDLHVITSYAGLQNLDADPLIMEDHRQLWQMLAHRAGPLDGLLDVLYDEPFEYGDESDGSIWGTHKYNVRYLANGTP